LGAFLAACWARGKADEIYWIDIDFVDALLGRAHPASGVGGGHRVISKRRINSFSAETKDGE